MKLTVNRQLSAGLYYVSFTVSDFSDEERKKMESFGVPSINLRYTLSTGATAETQTAITNINGQLKAYFRSQKEATEYETSVRNQVTSSINWLRNQKDDFTSTDEVTL